MIDNSRASLKLLLNISRELSSSLDLHTVLARVIILSARNVGAERGSLIALDSNGEPVDAALVVGEELVPSTVETLRATLDQGLAGWVMRHREAALIKNTSADERWVRRPDDEARSNNGKSAVCLPVMARDKMVGILTIVHSKAGFFTTDHLALLEAIASQAGSAINNAQLYDSLEGITRRYRDLFEDSIDPILITAQNGQVLEANRQAVQTFGFPLDTLLKRKITDLHNANWESLGTDFAHVCCTQTVQYETEVKNADGKRIPVEVYVREVKLSDQATFQWILRDISERKALDSMRDELMATIYHDLRSPLANIVSSLDMLESMIPPENAASVSILFQISSRSIERMQRLISSLLDINRLEAGQPITNQKETNIASLLNEAIDTIQMVIESKRLEIRTQLQDDLPPVFVDVDMIRRVVINLLDNATKFTPQGSKIIVGAMREGALLRVWVEDTGPGIPEQARESIFEKFTRMNTERAPKGLGLGLAFCRLAIEAHGGKIWVEGEPGSGSRFVFTLPVQRGKA